MCWGTWCHVVGWVLRRSRPLGSEDEGITFLRGVPNLSLKETASEPRRLNPQPHLLENLIPGIKRASVVQALVINIDQLKRNISNKIFICIQDNILNGAGKLAWSCVWVTGRVVFVIKHERQCSIANNEARSSNNCCCEKQQLLHNLSVCIFSLRYPACNAHAPYSHLRTSPLYNIFLHIS